MEPGDESITEGEFSYFATCTSVVFIYTVQDEELARQLVELGYRGSGEVLKREEFEARKAAAAASKLACRDQQRCIVCVCVCVCVYLKSKMFFCSNLVVFSDCTMD